MAENNKKFCIWYRISIIQAKYIGKVLENIENNKEHHLICINMGIKYNYFLI